MEHSRRSRGAPAQDDAVVGEGSQQPGAESQVSAPDAKELPAALEAHARRFFKGLENQMALLVTGQAAELEAIRDGLLKTVEFGQRLQASSTLLGKEVDSV